MKTVAVDIDNVLAKHAEALMAFYSSISGLNLTAENYSEDWRWIGERDDIYDVGKKFVASGVHAQMEVIPGSLEALQILKQNFKLVIITARKKEVMDMTLVWAEKHFPNIFDGVHFAQVWEEGQQKITKADLCRQVDASFLIDDSLEHCTLVAAAGIETLLFGNYKWNQATDLPERVTRVNNWQEVLEYFNDKG